MLFRKNKPLYTKVAEHIMEKIQTGDFFGTLPSEDHLAKLLDVSKSTVREAISVLTSQGMICKRHGVGNVIMNSVLNCHARIDVDLDFLKALEKEGYQTKVQHSFSKIKQIDLPFLPKGEYFTYNEFKYAGATPAVYAHIYIPVHFFKNKFPPEDLPKPNMFSFVEEYTREEIAHTMVFLEAAKTDEFLSTAFSMPIDRPILSWREVLYSLNDEPICYTHLYFNENVFCPVMIRKGFFAESVNSEINFEVLPELE